MQKFFVLLVLVEVFVHATGTTNFMRTSDVAHNLHVESDLISSPRLLNIGTIEGKSYFMENATTYTWTSAKAYCSGLGMQLATITTQTQLNFLKSKAALLTTKYYWTAARDSLELTQFNWDTDSGPLAAPEFLLLGTIRSALLLHVISSTESHYHSESITTTHNVLCQTL